MRITVKELHNLVWSMPMTSVAEKLRVSDVAVRKICVKHKIPRPPQGYWQRQHRKGEVSAINHGIAEKIIVINSPTAEVTVATNDVYEFPKAVSALLEKGVSTRLSNGSKVCLQAMEKGYPDRYGFLRLRQDVPRRVLVTKAALRRAYLLSDWLYQLAPLLDFNIKPQKKLSGNAAFALEMNSISIDVTIKERVTRRAIPLKERRDRYGPEFDFLPTGELSILYEGTWGASQTVSDTKSLLLEQQLHLVVQKLIKCRDLSFVKSAEFRERRRSYQLQRREVVREKLIADYADQRRRNFLAMKDEVQTNRSMVDFLTSLGAQKHPNLGEEFNDWLKWANEEFTLPELFIVQRHNEQDLEIVRQLEVLKDVLVEDDSYPWPD
ncbi:MAG: hypothetical protein KBT72_09080 [Zhongshania sp.]|nr:hypothetical protein [Zhongshania sp.]